MKCKSPTWQRRKKGILPGAANGEIVWSLGTNSEIFTFILGSNFRARGRHSLGRSWWLKPGAQLCGCEPHAPFSDRTSQRHNIKTSAPTSASFSKMRGGYEAEHEPSC